MSNFLEIFEAELDKYNIAWCTGCDSYGSHKRGFVNLKTKVIHYDSKIATRKTLHGGLHEVGHVVTNTPGMRRWQEEEAAERFATNRMRELGISVPRATVKAGKRYVKRMKRWGNNISKGRREG